MNRIHRFIISTTAFIRKEVMEVLRQTRLVVVLILGPFFILLLFGLGYREDPRTLRTLFVVPEGSVIEPQIEAYATTLQNQIEYMGITHDPDEADRRLRRQEIDLVIVTPHDPLADVQNNEQSVFTLYHFEIDPFEEAYVTVLGRIYTTMLNEDVLEKAADMGKEEALTLQERIQAAEEESIGLRIALDNGDVAAAQTHYEQLSRDMDLITFAVGSLALLSGLDEAIQTSNPAGTQNFVNLVAGVNEDVASLENINEAQDSFAEEVSTVSEVETQLNSLEGLIGEFSSIDSHILVRPFETEVKSITNVTIQTMHYFVPGVIALLLQHIAVTFAALSITRERRVGTIELFRVSPLSALEALLGKYLGYLILASGIGVVLTLLVVFVLNVPMIGDWRVYAFILTTLLTASLGVGFAISLVARSESQAVQFSMIVLLASVFFSGFFIGLRRIVLPYRVISWLLPATYGTSLLQEVMLRGKNGELSLYLGLLAIIIVLFTFAWLRLRTLLSHD